MVAFGHRKCKKKNLIEIRMHLTLFKLMATQLLDEESPSRSPGSLEIKEVRKSVATLIDFNVHLCFVR